MACFEENKDLKTEANGRRVDQGNTLAQHPCLLKVFHPPPAGVARQAYLLRQSIEAL